MNHSLYDTLGIAKDASATLIKGAYRNAVKSYHPDAGGSREEFERVQQAYDILIDPVKRLTYDATGKINETPSDEHAAMLNTIQTAMERVIDNAQASAESVDIVEKLRDLFLTGITKMHEHIESTEAQAKTFEKVQKRIKTKSKNNMLANMLEHKIKSIREGQLKIKVEIVTANKALEFLSDYSFDALKHQLSNQSSTQMLWSQLVQQQNPFRNTF